MINFLKSLLPHIHRWSPWIVHETFNLTDTITKGIVGKIYMQTRCCTGCGLREFKKDTVSL